MSDLSIQNNAEMVQDVSNDNSSVQIIEIPLGPAQIQDQSTFTFNKSKDHFNLTDFDQNNMESPEKSRIS